MKGQYKLAIIDVDGTMTDAGIYYDDYGNELKKFCTKDAAGFFAARAAGIETLVLTGRESEATARRMKELHIDYLFQGVRDKESFVKEFLIQKCISSDEVIYIGDDLNDLSPMKCAAYVACPADSCQEVKEISDYISPVLGGHGVIRDVFEHLLRESGEWERVVRKVYHIGV